MNILVLSRYGQLGASSRVRMYQYVPYLQAHDVTISVAPFLSDRYLSDLYSGRGRHPFTVASAYFKRLCDLHKASEFDVIWLEKEVAPWLPAWAERWFNRSRIPYIVDYDDAVFLNYDRHRLRVVRRLLEKKIDEVMRRAAVVVAGNAYLADRATRAGASNVEILPTVIDLEHYSVADRDCIQPFTIGWIGTPVTSPYLRLIESALAEVCAASTARLVTVGAGDLAFKGVAHEARTWSERTETADVQSFDCGIMPLPDADWERGKCGYKLIQYMACGLPVVASPVGVNCEIVGQGVNGFLASDPEEWVKALTTLRDDHELCKRMGAASRQKVEQNYSIQIMAPRMLALLKSATDKGRPLL